MDHFEIASAVDSSTLAALSVRMPQLPTSSSELSQQINSDTRNVSRPCLGRVVTCVPTSRWVPDQHTTQCMAPDCRQQFSLFNRKHHCRICGKIFCTNCCSKSLSAPAVYATLATTEETNRLAHRADHSTAAAAAAAGGPSGGGGRTHGHVKSVSSGADVATASSSAAATVAAGQHAPNAAATAAAASPAAVIAAATAQKPSMVTVKVCRECYYDHQLAVCRRDIATAEPRRRQRGELKMMQRARLIQICSYLPMADLFNFSLVCSDFYFITRDNAIWIWLNAARWPDKRLTGRSLAGNNANSNANNNNGNNSYAVAKYRPNSDDDLSYHCSYNFTQFLHYCHLLESTRCEGLSNFANSARHVLSGYVKVAVIGPECVGKTLMIQRFLNGGAACVASPSSSAPAADAAAHHQGAAVGGGGGVTVGGGGHHPTPVASPATAQPQQSAPHHHPNCVYPLVPAGAGAHTYRPTAGLAVSQKQVVITGGLSLEASGLTIIDVAGSAACDKLRAMACRGAHAIIMCYNAHSKKSLIDAAMQAFALEAELGPQPIIVCGIAGSQGQRPLEVSPAEAAPSSGRGRASIQVAPTAHGGAEAFSAAVQAVLEKLMDGGRHAAELLALSSNPSVLDVLLDLKG